VALRPLSNLQAILFDLGGTLDGDGEHWLNRFYLIYQEYLPLVTWEKLKAAFYQADARCMADLQVVSLGLAGLIRFHVDHQLAALQINSPELAQVLTEKFFAASQTKLRRNAGILSRLAPRFRLGVVSNFYGNAARILDEVGIAPWLMAIVDSQVVGLRKPDPAIFSLALASLGCAPEAAAYVGDSYNQDIRPAKQLGLTAIWLRNDAMSAPLPADFSPDLADYQIHVLPEIESLVP
jgi:HAD superfamily hydrolase (TIGR01549 family)